MGKCPECEEGAPAWLLTYGDMITLVLCFFVMLLSMATLSKPKVTRTMRMFQQQFGVLPKFRTAFQIFKTPQQLTETESFVLRRGPPGQHTAVTTIRDDDRTKMVLGGKDGFPPGSAKLTPRMQEQLRNYIAPALRGYRNRIDVRGHTASPLGDGSQDVWHLSFLRARNVMEYLIREGQIDPRRFRVVSAGDNEPIASNKTASGRMLNRRVEVVMTEELIRDPGVFDGE